jgi:hypothetical protein
MSFNVLFMAHSPDADPNLHRSQVDTGKFKVFTVVVKDQAQELEVARGMTAAHELDSILLCPGFSHSDAAEIFEMLGGRVGVSVARGDGVSNRIALEARRRAYGLN